MQREVLRKWAALQQEMDYNGDGCVSAEEFINGMKRTAMKLAPGTEHDDRGDGIDNCRCNAKYVSAFSAS